ncbi:MAG: hypothetical protein KatS3mg061_3237 [Dehalococcoidia bacterium]|nr:MAG: hypothetical protein KatS3mg061_3237 [Dehalococcoidia bacterium]
MLDTLILMGCAALTVPDLAARNVTADFWLVFLLFIVGAAFHFGPVGVVLYILFLSGFFSWGYPFLLPPGERDGPEPARAACLLLYYRWAGLVAQL